MSAIKDGGSAFATAAYGPSDDCIFQPGLSKREWYAGMALAGMRLRADARDYRDRWDEGCSGAAAMAFTYADAMIAQSEKDEQP
jgi:hypothetical protein